MNPNNDTNNGAKVCDHCGCGCKHHVVGPIAIILIGVAVLLETFGVLSAYATNVIWPILLIIAASGKLCRCCCRK